MANKKNNVLIIGAGFSAPAKLPIQDRILREITRKQTENILSYKPMPESYKFLLAYINVGLYLLQNYTRESCSELLDERKVLEIDSKTISDYSQLELNKYYRDVQLLKEKIRTSLENSKIQISLEDVFTSFDKSYQSKNFLHSFSYQNLNIVQEDIIRLFVYYFGKSCREHHYDSSEYLDFCNYIKHSSNTVILSTNWDVLLEEYFNRNNIKYNLCLNEPYYTLVNNKTPASKKEIKLIKLHGSINWFKCSNCGTINVAENCTCGDYLFDDASSETCSYCNEKTKDGQLLKSQIITPTMLKSIDSQLYNNIWFTARRNLMEACKIIFVGYSLPMADFELRYLLHQSIPAGTPIDVVLYHDDNPEQVENPAIKNLLPERRYRDLFVKNEVNFYYNGFGEYFKNLTT